MSNVFRRTVYILINKTKQSLPSSRHKSTEANILKSVYQEVEGVNHITVNDFAWQNLDRWPDKTLTVCAATGHGYTYAQTHRMSISFAASLRLKLKLCNDDKVAVILPNVPEYPCVALGILEAGCIASMMNPAYTAHELKVQLELIECKAIVSSKLSYPNIIQALKELKLNIPVILIDNDSLPEGTIKFAEFAEDLGIDTDCLKKVKRSTNDVAILPFSSGTTGFPKGVVLTHKSVNAMNKMIFDPKIIAVDEASATHQSVLPAVLPFFHIFGFNLLMMNLMGRGAKLVTLPVFKPDLFLEAIVKFKAQHLYIVPPMAVFLGKHPAVTPRHLETIKDIVCGAAPVSKSDAEAILEKKKGLIFRQGYGLTETNGGISVGHNKDTNHAAVGHNFAGSEVKIADLNTQEALGSGKEGEIWYRGPNLMTGYYKNEAATKEVLTDDGWYKTGDIGKYDDNGYLYVTDRLKELIKVKGFQVPPAELEMILRTHPKILDCAVLGIPDPITGEVPKAFVVTQSGQTAKSEEILEYVNSKVVAFKRIKDVQFVDAIPKNAAGKILRKDLKAKYC
ncbi:4-coumarate--CoA ligase 1-like isoform X1 [Maniola jurtina]|uniref:4-coumarate--CoA ligase 1-like isoform X1 n=1 Tax=Maniola jurtina TaxID=191418 RepID=UPI001E68A402|nr:4-coumarate--CoA ligase 1-like isoform X1 [Maniola jurtina]XP_045773973.1 4-coumarate--CoA ligase 1-like isoform X2 [Maniola jurtina]XP_045773974.1 4-coumarate--CoA ligase 1-like isoform X1 [Maniola jurtina]